MVRIRDRVRPRRLRGRNFLCAYRSNPSRRPEAACSAPPPRDRYTSNDSPRLRRKRIAGDMPRHFRRLVPLRHGAEREPRRLGRRTTRADRLSRRYDASQPVVAHGERGIVVATLAVLRKQRLKRRGGSSRSRSRSATRQMILHLPSQIVVCHIVSVLFRPLARRSYRKDKTAGRNIQIYSDLPKERELSPRIPTTIF